jgi:hypothetical protein
MVQEVSLFFLVSRNHLIITAFNWIPITSTTYLVFSLYVAYIIVMTFILLVYNVIFAQYDLYSYIFVIYLYFRYNLC